MVTRNQQGGASRRRCCCNEANGPVCGFTCAHCGGKVTRMPDHIWVRDVGNNEALVAMLKCGDHRRRDRLRLHVRCYVVGGNTVTGNKGTPLTRKGLFDATVQEVGDMRVFLCLRNVQLTQACSGNDSSK